MLDFHEVNCEAKIRQNTVQVWETIKSKDMSLLVTMKEAYAENVSSGVSSSFIILTQFQNKYCWSKVWYKIYKKTHLWYVNNRKVVITPSALLLLNLYMLIYIFYRIPGKHKSTLKFFKYISIKKIKKINKLNLTLRTHIYYSPTAISKMFYNCDC